jgi:hypothetical protein
MDFYKNLPLPVRIAIPALVGLIVLFVLYSTMLKAAPPVEVIKTQDVGVHDVAMQVLERNGIEADESQDGNNFMLHVAADDATDAATAIAASGLRDRTGLAKKIDCPAPPGFTATKAANERASNCEAAKSVQGMILAAGAIAANVQVSQEANGTLLGPEKSMNVVVQVFLPEQMKRDWNAEQAARAISRSVGTTLDRVSITNDQLQSMFDGTSTATESATSGATSMLGCDDIASATEVETKRAAVRTCYESTIGSKLTELLGGSDRYVLTVEPTIDSVSRNTVTVKNTKGPVTDTSAQKGDGQSAIDTTSPPNKTETTSTDPAGDISSLRISVILDKSSVTEDQRVAVMSLLSTQIDAKRGDPAPTVKMSTFAGGAGDAPTNEDLAQIKENAEQNNTTPGGAAMGGATGGRPPAMALPTWAMALMAVLVVGMITAMLVLWRRSSAINAERKRLEESFQREQRLFEDFAQQNPDHLAQDLNALFGAPSAPPRTPA